MTVWVYARPSRARRILDAIKDLPYVLEDRITDDADTAFARRLMLAVLLLPVLACLIWLASWWAR